ncbi:MAG: alpha/beta fold hydrolase, partial [Sphingomonadales bacterium]
GFNALYIYDMIDLEVKETLLSFDDRDVVNTVSDPYTGNIVGAYYHDNGNKYVYFDKDFKKFHAMVDKALPGTNEWLTSRTRDGKRYLVYSSSDIDSGSYYYFDTETKQMAFLQARYPMLDPQLMSPMQEITYKARDGMEIQGYLTIPVGKEVKNLPTVILPHGGPTARDYWGFDWLVQFLASRGYAVLQPNFRGSAGFGKDFENAGKREWGLKMQDDITDGALWLVEEGITDPERMCIFGWSYGGYAALAATFTTPDLFQCAVSVNGISDLYRLVTEESNFLGLSEWGEEIGDPQSPSDKARMKATSAIENIDKIRMPVLLLANNDDTVVNYLQSKRFHDKMQKAGKYSEYIEMKEGNHSAGNEPSRLTILSNLERFLARYIGKGN